MKIQIVTVAINLWDEYTKPMLDSIRTSLEHRILFFDNKSTDNTKEEAGKLVSDIFSHRRLEERPALSSMWNEGIRDGFQRGFDYVLVCNNDILFHPASIDALTERISKGDVGIATMHNVRGSIENPIDIFNFSVPEIEESEHPDFSCFMITKECFDKVGEFDEIFNPAYFEDNDYHYRMKLAGLKAINYPGAIYYHFGSRTQNEALDTPAVPGPLFVANSMKYQQKWGGMPGSEKHKQPYGDFMLTYADTYQGRNKNKSS